MNEGENQNFLSQERTSKTQRRIRNKKPDFKQQESWRYKRVKERWRRPRGLDSKIRKKVKGWPSSPKIGYRSSKALRGLHPSGYEEIIVWNPNDVDKVDPKTQVIRIGRTVGMKKKVEISSLAQKKGIHILNPRQELKPEKEEELEEVKKS